MKKKKGRTYEERTYVEQHFDTGSGWYTSPNKTIVDWDLKTARIKIDKRVEEEIAKGWKIKRRCRFMDDKYYDDGSRFVYYYMEVCLTRNKETKLFRFIIDRDTPI